MVSSDPVNEPEHYKRGRLQVIDVIDDVVASYPPLAAYYAGQVLRYVHRAPHKDNYTQDLRKAQWYLNRLVAKAMEADAKNNDSR